MSKRTKKVPVRKILRERARQYAAAQPHDQDALRVRLDVERRQHHRRVPERELVGVPL